MKKLVLPSVLCVIFLLFSMNVSIVFAFKNETLEFHFNNLIFSYSLEHNIKTSSQFDINEQINRHNRFGSKEERKNLLKKMLDLKFDERVALEYIFPKLGLTINKIEKNINVKPKNATLKINTNSEKVFFTSKEINGLELNKSKLFSEIISAYLTDKPLIFQLPTNILPAQVLEKDFSKFINLRADFSTNIENSSPDRKHNVKNALSSLNRVEVYPNEIFSFNEIVGKRTEENGYRNAKIIVNNEFVDGIGGGVCQVSSTLYNAALLSGMEILEANKHSKQVGYVKYGFDAMVNFGSSDLKFRNNTNEKITIITNYSPSKLRIRIFGQDLNGTEYKLSNEIVNVVEPVEEIIFDYSQEYSDKVQYEDESFCLKKASRGMEIKSYREKYVNGQLNSKTLLRTDKFKVQNAVIVYGTKKREKNEAENLITSHSFSLTG